MFSKNLQYIPWLRNNRLELQFSKFSLTVISVIRFFPKAKVFAIVKMYYFKREYFFLYLKIFILLNIHFTKLLPI